MSTFSYLYSIPYIMVFLLLYINAIPLYKSNATFLFNYNYYIWLQTFFGAVLLIIFFGFRGFIYSDWISYYPVYNASPTLFDDSYRINRFFARSWENGFLFYMILCKTISPNYFFFQFVSFVIDFFILFHFFKRIIPRYIAFGFLLFILFSGINLEFNLLRNSKALMLFLISLKYLEEKKIVKYIILNSIGVLFHITALLYLPLYFFLNKNIHRRIILFIFIIGNIVFLLQIEWCRLLLTSISTMIPGRLGVLLKVYLSSDLNSRAYGISIGYIERVFSFVLIYCFSEKLCRINKNNLIYINTYFIYCFIFLYFSEIKIILERITILFIFPYWILFPKIYSLLKYRYKQIFLVVLLFYSILKLGVGNMNIFSLYDNVLFPHKSFQERSKIFFSKSEYVFK